MMDKHERETNIAGGVRPIRARWVITGEMVLASAAHFGGREEGSVDMTVLRDPKEGLPLLPGTSLAGAIRSHLADVLGGYRSDEHRDVALFFGAARGNDEGSQSPLIVFDALGKIPEGLSEEIRAGVAINPATGTAEAHKKFDFEVLPAGTVFPLRVELIIEDPGEEGRTLGLLVSALDGLTAGEIALGMRRSRGLGAVTVRRWKAVRHDLATDRGWIRWLTSDHEKPIGDDVPGHATATEAVRSVSPSLKMECPKDQRRRVVVDLALEFVGDLLVRSPATEPGAPDVGHLHTAGKPVLPGTGLGGALRAQALRIARLVRQGKGDGDLWVDRLFGPRLEGEDEEAANNTAAASKLRISESFLANGAARRQTRIAVDRFTGGVVSGALFEEAVQCGGKLKVRLELRNPDDPEIGFLLLLLKDLLSGEVPVGGAVSVGRGILKGAAQVRWSDGKSCRIEPGLKADNESLERFNRLIQAFWGAAPLHETEVRP
ncbi:MAG: hypothetical protein GX443_14770 [Deltaproteobacteria bacterium]|nr:hypothetical protein [Deltaproteobacteria bacterium]